MKGFRTFITELQARDPSGKEITIHKQPVRLVSGKMKMMYPAKSGSSKGGK